MVVTGLLMVKVMMLSASTTVAAADGLKQKEQGYDADSYEADDGLLFHLINHGQLGRFEAGTRVRRRVDTVHTRRTKPVHQHHSCACTHNLVAMVAASRASKAPRPQRCREAEPWQAPAQLPADKVLNAAPVLQHPAATAVHE
jgi:hypothetical protein